MKKKLSIALAITAIAPFGLVACGDDDDDSSSESGSTETATEESTTEDTAGSGGSGTVAFTAAEDGSLAFEEDSAETEAGSVTVELDNPSSVPHNVEIEGSDGSDLGGTETVTGESTSATVELEPGDYIFYCSVSGHREAGMEGDLTVE